MDGKTWWQPIQQKTIPSSGLALVQDLPLARTSVPVYSFPSATNRPETGIVPEKYNASSWLSIGTQPGAARIASGAPSDPSQHLPSGDVGNSFGHHGPPSYSPAGFPGLSPVTGSADVPKTTAGSHSISQAGNASIAAPREPTPGAVSRDVSLGAASASLDAAQHLAGELAGEVQALLVTQEERHRRAETSSHSASQRSFDSLNPDLAEVYDRQAASAFTYVWCFG